MILHLEIITPERIVYQDEVSEVVVPTVSGQITILPNHIPLLTKIAPGELIIKKQEKDQFLAIESGFLELSNNKISILADYAVRSEEIEIAKVQEAQKRAQKRMEEKGTERDFAEAEALFKRTLLELKIAEKRRHRTAAPPVGTQ